MRKKRAEGAAVHRSEQGRSWGWIYASRQRLGTLVALAIATVSLAAVMALPAFGGHLHTAGSWCSGINHGLEHATNNDYFVQPYNSINGLCSAEHIISINRAPEAVRLGGNSCASCNWISLHWDTSPYAECRYYSKNFTRTYLNTHAHGHHNFCG